MPEQKPEEKFSPQPPNIVIRTMKGDLEAQRTGGGQVMPQIPELNQPPTPTEDAFLYQGQPPQPGEVEAPQPPTLEPPATPPPTPPPPAPPPLETNISFQPMPPQPAPRKSLRPLFITLGVIFGVVALASVGYFGIWPQVEKLRTPLPSPTAIPSPSPSPTPTPSPVNPEIVLRQAPEATTTITLFEKTPAGLLTALAQAAAAKAASGTIATLAITGPDGQYLDSSEFIQLLVQNPLPSFTLSLGKKYLAFLYFAKGGASFGFATEILPETKESVVDLLKSWEAANIDKDFSLLFLGAEPGKRSLANFRSVTLSGLTAREMTYASGLSLIYAFKENILFFATNREGFNAFAKKLP